MILATWSDIDRHSSDFTAGSNSFLLNKNIWTFMEKNEGYILSRSLLYLNVRFFFFFHFTLSYFIYSQLAFDKCEIFESKFQNLYSSLDVSSLLLTTGVIFNRIKYPKLDYNTFDILFFIYQTNLFILFMYRIMYIIYWHTDI